MDMLSPPLTRTTIHGPITVPSMTTEPGGLRAAFIRTLMGASTKGARVLQYREWNGSVGMEPITP